MIRILLVRHGETEWNKEHRLQGRSDIALADSGVEQARITGSFIRAQNPTQGHVSALIRTQQTFQQFGLDLTPRIWEELMEQNLGEWEGLRGAEVRERFPEEFEGWRAKSYTPAGGESHAELLERMQRAFFEIVRGTAETQPTESADLSFPVRTAVVVSHGAALRVLLEGLGLITRRAFIPLTPAAVTVVDIPLHTGELSTSLPHGGITADDDAGLIASLTDEQIADRVRLRLINLSPELLNPAATSDAL
ncbi:histidine phosphatase family protein [Nesterenkonia flava]|uniref:Histidine phosphatase family protein n=1 Tax=Nesterenkonia flava TaxID=469799 RepID=A0ABU1FRB0_9MICC|nr:histidine phosphatase family protein [Nesterenkonia flava]MDR5710711.1 histidine phosphatase family protein [Nesterenkonia flava]